MKASLMAALALLLAPDAGAHRLDEYLQGAILSVEKNQLHAQMTLTPGVAVLPVLSGYIDASSDASQRAYADRVLSDLSLSIDGSPLTPHLVSMSFPTADDMKEGLGEIHIDFTAGLPRGPSRRRLILQNHHLPAISAYQVNVLVPRDPDIRVVTQKRNESQSLYELDYTQAGVPATYLSNPVGWLGILALLLLTRFWLLSRRRAGPFQLYDESR